VSQKTNDATDRREEAVSAARPTSSAPALGGRLRAAGGRYGVLMFLVAMVLVFSLAMPDLFPTAGNFRAMIESQAVLLLLALAATVPLRAGDFDLSIAALMTTTAALGTEMLERGWPIVAIVLAALSVGVVVGLVNGFFVVKVGVDSFVTTLGTLTALTGATFAISGGQVSAGLEGAVLDVARTPVLGLPLMVWYGWLLVVFFWYLYERTPFGRYLLFVGGGRDVARLAGLPVDRIRMGAYVFSGSIAGLTGVVLLGDLGAFDPSVGFGYLLQPFAAAFLGATVLYVGRFNAVGTLIGLYLLTVGITGLTLMGAQSWVSDVFNGLALIAAVTLARLAGGTKATRS
jgi:ribose transport system permease protein